VAPEAVFVQEEYRLFFGDDDFCEWLFHEITDLVIPMQTLDPKKSPRKFTFSSYRAFASSGSASRGSFFPHTPLDMKSSLSGSTQARNTWLTVS
jgi:hypothetical protein